MKRLHVILVLGLAMGIFLAFDLGRAEQIDRFAVPPLLAIGSGKSPGTAHCAAVPPSAR